MRNLSYHAYAKCFMLVCIDKFQGLTSTISKQQPLNYEHEVVDIHCMSLILQYLQVE